MMEKPEDTIAIKYTTRCYDPGLANAFAEHPVLTGFSSDQLSGLHHDVPQSAPSPIVEVVTVTNDIDSKVARVNIAQEPKPLEHATNTNIKDRYLILHSEVLSQTIRDIVQFYPEQTLSGTSLVIHEPYKCLLHHFSDLEHELEKTEDSIKLQHLEALLQFLRPMFHRYIVPARCRLSMAPPTVKFEDVWVLLKPGSFAYTKWEDHWLGCIIAESIMIPPVDKFAQYWSIGYWILQVHWPSDEMRFAKNSVVIRQYDGEQLVTSLPICPVEIHDAQDLEERRKQLTERGQKTCKLIWEDSRLRESRVVLQHEYFGSNNKLTGLRADHFMVNVENIEPLDKPSNVPDPILSGRKFSTIHEMVEFQGRRNGKQSCLSKRRGNGLVILLHGPPGVGKSHTIESISSKTCRPLISIGEDLGVINQSLDIGIDMDRWFSIAEKWNDLKLASLKSALKSFNCLLFLTTNKVGALDSRLSSLADFVVFIEEFDDERRSKVWGTLEEDFRRKDERIVLTTSATKLLHLPKTQIGWNGYEMNGCFKTAIALATARAGSDSNTGSDKITVDDENFKEAMNIAHEYRRYKELTLGGLGPEMARREALDPPSARQTNTRPAPRMARQVWASSPTSSDDEDARLTSGRGGRARLGYTFRPGSERTQTRPGRLFEDPLPDQQGFFQPDYDPNLCVPALKCLEWDAFQAAVKNRELFRKTEFYAIDVLVGEPHIKLKPENKGRRKRRVPPQSEDISTTLPHVVSEQRLNRGTAGPGDEPLPERIRINSPTLAEAFSEITEESLEPAFLLFRPFRSLVYYEQEFRNWIVQQKTVLEGIPPDTTEAKDNDDSMEPDAKRKRILAGLQEMHCLLSFIDNYIKKRQAYLLSDRCVSVTFADLALLFNPGDLVVAKDLKQAFRVTKVTSGRHRARTRDEGDLDFWKDETEAEFDETPIFVHTTHVDFDGVVVGPVAQMSMFLRFDGQVDVSSLSIYPLRHSKDAGLRERLIERGKTFLKVAGIKHMHYTGLTLETRDEIDSQAVIDFDEAFTRFTHWRPSVTHPTNEWLLRMAQDPKFKPRPEDEWVVHYRNTLISKNKPCIKECCAAEIVHHDDYVEVQRMMDYIVAQINQKTSIAPPVSINPTSIKDIKEPLTDEDYLIMSYRVYGFVLRSRKWHQLDMTYISEVAIIGEGEGFDQLVLPPGHGDMVKSMIRQHLRDRKLASAKRDKDDVLNTGRGLIMLLHGVPGVGKTSTAECVADSFRRPLFQITSGDLGTTAREVEEALEQNFNLASRWDCILLIDEADVFLGERSKEDFVRNSLVAVFLRMMEYYAGVLFLTTNRVGVFDEAFTSRVHISLYYPPLDRDATLQIFAKNWDRIRSRYHKNNREVEIKESEITQFALDYFENNKDGRWNGRQIRNAFQSALALAELDALGTDDLLDDTDHGRTVVLGKKNFETVAHAYRGFLDYMKQVYGADFARRARENLWRYDAFGLPKFPNALTTRLKVAEPGPPEMSQPRAPPGPQPWAAPAGPQPPQAGYGYREPQPSTSYYQPQPPPPPQQPYYPGHYDYQDQRPRHMAAQDPYVPPAPQERFASSSNPYARGGERYAAGPERVPPTPEQSYHRSVPRESGFPGREAEDPR
ncbi:hypothetical protein PG993_000250 [Apiospora rasikravindrae]|uniref:AAA+ ATPase domain-containing protein n=1 Tax=Apiospora rasikravindrae TaxID=990691 RepID=A0ABR1UAQ5_9PEZI